jgi:hypothetical protein
VGVRVVPALLGYDAGVRGAIALAMEHPSLPKSPTSG